MADEVYCRFCNREAGQSHREYCSMREVEGEYVEERDENLRDRIAAALRPCLERAHNEYQLADAALAVVRGAK